MITVLVTVAMAAPRVVMEPAGPGLPPRVLQVDDTEATFVSGLLARHDEIYPSYDAARAVARHPVVYPTDILATELADTLDAIAASQLAHPDRNQLVVELISASAALDNDALREWLAIGASLGSIPLDDLELPPAVQERASYDAAAFRSQSRPMGSWYDDPAVLKTWTRDAWLADRWRPALEEPLSTLLFTHTELKPRLDAQRAIDQTLYGVRSPGLFVRPAPVHTFAGTGGVIGAAKAALASVDASTARTRSVAAAPPPTTLSVEPVVTVEPTAFFQHCREILTRLPADWHTPRSRKLAHQCRTAATQRLVDEGGAESANAAWQTPAWPEGVRRSLPLRWSHGQNVEGLARVGVRMLDIAVAYDRPPVVKEDGEVVKVALRPTHRTLLVPVWVAFSSPQPPGPAAIQDAAQLATADAMREALTYRPAPPSWGCRLIPRTSWFVLLVACGVVRRRS